MNKKLSISILILMISTFLAYGQNISFQKNVNIKASALLQHLNTDENSLLLESKKTQILHVDIFNKDFSKRIDVYGNKTEIDLSKLPVGNFVIQAKVDKRLIVMYLEKYENLETASLNQSKQNLNRDGFTPMGKPNRIEEKGNSLCYWVVSERNSNFGSSKTMTLEYKEDINKLISKNKLELKSNTGKYNKLIIYAIYNKSKFMNKQFRNPKFYKIAEQSKLFNTEPVYTSNPKNNSSKP